MSKKVQPQSRPVTIAPTETVNKHSDALQDQLSDTVVDPLLGTQWVESASPDDSNPDTQGGDELTDAFRAAFSEDLCSMDSNADQEDDDVDGDTVCVDVGVAAAGGGAPNSEDDSNRPDNESNATVSEKGFPVCLSEVFNDSGESNDAVVISIDLGAANPIDVPRFKPSDITDVAPVTQSRVAAAATRDARACRGGLETPWGGPASFAETAKAEDDPSNDSPTHGSESMTGISEWTSENTPQRDWTIVDTPRAELGVSEVGRDVLTSLGANGIAQRVGHNQTPREGFEIGDRLKWERSENAGDIAEALNQRDSEDSAVDSSARLVDVFDDATTNWNLDAKDRAKMGAILDIQGSHWLTDQLRRGSQWLAHNGDGVDQIAKESNVEAVDSSSLSDAVKALW